MPNLASILKNEILRLARKEVRKEIEALKTASAKYRSEIAALKRGLSDLEKRLGRSQAGKGERTPRPSQEEGDAKPTRHRYSPKGLTKLRARLGLSGADMGRLLGVTTQSIYNWEAEKTFPRANKIEALVELRKVGKREIKARLAAMGVQAGE